MAESKKLKESLLQFIGHARFRKFVRAGVGERMLFWQEREIERFRLANPNLQFELSDLGAALRICDVHEIDLLPCRVDVFRGHLYWDQAYVNEMRSSFPYACVDPIMVPDDFPGDHLDYWYCPECRRVAGKWRESR